MAARAIEGDRVSILSGGEFATLSNKVALQRASSPLVTNFAKLEIEEQTAIAKAFGSRPGAVGVTAKHAAMLSELEAANGPEFDALYVKAQTLGHQKLLIQHRSYSLSGSDPVAQGASLVAVTGIKTRLQLLKGIRAASA